MLGETEPCRYGVPEELFGHGDKSGDNVIGTAIYINNTIEQSVFGFLYWLQLNSL